ncbi:hypothetical protein [Deinococcus soli (ex Cha et al. 2016)]|uniref:Uncharacterized protein n=2 Tax=Deinococcus soli (ex Cha et al. 2016) TaxID=1309411 RepID=A0AAE4BME1_9DEIO|nr:hypothetical protein [Deinococcus soli (ex Cha et al. 2016)]MDR6218407.1 hypothetical protein [Deinococcus soli (ex Cha et al. 2016)]MDR6329147.1 hypothetical protein [Deinococcus soli (ex Cha et al. 2016)]MDR6751420.1 hypothetical protein [Deinococcus soli (ex Cha et al. 2016)]
MMKMTLDVARMPSVFNDQNAFPDKLPVEKTTQTHCVNIVTVTMEQPQMALNLAELGQGMLDALALMQADGYEPEPVHVSDELLARMQAFSIGD